MSNVNLQIPDSLHRQLEERAQRLGISLQDLIVDTLLHVVRVPDVAEQKAAFEEVRSRYPKDQAEAALRKILSARE
jgi:hypothetical protein